MHTLEKIKVVSLDRFDIRTASKEDIPLIVDMINHSYTDLSVTYEQIHELTQLEVYDNNLWIIAYEKESACAVGCGIGELDKEAGEGVLEWIQVLPDYRGQKIGQLIVTELLSRMVGKADFATVSGKMDNPLKPEVVYRKCGFEGNDIWHVLSVK